MSRKIISYLMLLSCSPILIFANNFTVSTKTNLVNKVASAKPGDTITVANGTYNWGQVSLTNNNGNATSAWIVIKAQTPNGVIFSGGTFLQFGGYHLMVTGFKFANGTSGADDVIQFRNSSRSNAVEAYYCRLNNVTIDSYNSDTAGCQLSPPAVTDTLNRWVCFYGKHNRMDHCTFINKYNGGPTVAVIYDSASYPGGGFSTYHLIDSNYFKIRGWQGGNEGETIRVGLGSMSNNDGFNIIEHNLIQYGTSSDPEIFSNKSNWNTYRYNTIKDATGSITMRQGRYNSVYGNFILKTTSSKIKSSQFGIRVIDKGQKVFNNYIEGLNGNSGKLDVTQCPIVIFSGQSPAVGLNPSIPGYYSADSSIIAFNTIVNCYGGAGIQIGLGKADKGVSAPFKPQGLVIANNIISMAKGQAIAIDTTVYPTATDSFSGVSNSLPVNYFAEGNIYGAPSFGFNNTTGFANQTLTFGKRTNGILPPPSSIAGTAINSLNYDSLLSGIDALGKKRISPYSVGAIEVGGTGNIVTYPLDSTMVGAGTPIIPLPVSIVSFTGQLIDGSVKLNWKVANEVGTYAYAIEYSIDGNNFSSIGQLLAQDKTIYYYLATLCANQNNYYRLRIVSEDGSVSYSSAILFSNSTDKPVLSLYPNPVRGNMTLSASHIKPNAQMIIVDILGRTIKTSKIENGMNPINVEGLHSGSYYISLIENGMATGNIPFIVQK